MSDFQRYRDAILAKNACDLHRANGKGYKKGCKDCFDENRPDLRSDDAWHDGWERGSFGDN